MKSITRLSKRSVKHVTTLCLGLLALGLVAVAPAQAASTPADLSVTATVASSCTIGTTTLAFGAYNPATTHLTAPLDGTGTVTVSCTLDAPVAITLGQGANALGGSTADVPLRQMASGANRLAYFLYTETTRTTVWGNTTASDLAFTGTGGSDPHTVFGRVTAGQNKPTGDYVDTVVATVTF
jgi:spore coat protein U-like protein